MPPSPPPPATRRSAQPSPTVSVVIPALNEESNIPHVLEGLPPVDEVVIVDGGSADETVAVAREIRPDAVVVRQTRTGKGNALACGFAASRGDIVVTLNADGSTDPGEIPRYVDALVSGAEVAHGSRYRDGGGDLGGRRFDRLGNAVLSWIVNTLFGTRFTDLGYGYNAYWRVLLPGLDLPEIDAPGLKRGRRLWGDGPEIEPLLNIRVAAQGMRVVEVASIGYPPIHGARERRMLRRALRALRTAIAEYARRWRIGHRMTTATGARHGAGPDPAVRPRYGAAADGRPESARGRRRGAGDDWRETTDTGTGAWRGTYEPADTGRGDWRDTDDPADTWRDADEQADAGPGAWRDMDDPEGTGSGARRGGRGTTDPGRPRRETTDPGRARREPTDPGRPRRDTDPGRPRRETTDPGRARRGAGDPSDTGSRRRFGARGDWREQTDTGQWQDLTGVGRREMSDGPRYDPAAEEQHDLDPATRRSLPMYPEPDPSWTQPSGRHALIGEDTGDQRRRVPKQRSPRDEPPPDRDGPRGPAGRPRSHPDTGSAGGGGGPTPWQGSTSDTGAHHRVEPDSDDGPRGPSASGPNASGAAHEVGDGRRRLESGEQRPDGRPALSVILGDRWQRGEAGERSAAARRRLDGQPHTGEQPRVSRPTHTGEQPGLTWPTHTGEQPGLTWPTHTGEQPGVSRPTHTGEQPSLTWPTHTGEQPSLSRPTHTGEQPGLTWPTHTGEQPSLTWPTHTGEQPGLGWQQNTGEGIGRERVRLWEPNTVGELNSGREQSTGNERIPGLERNTGREPGIGWERNSGGDPAPGSGRGTGTELNAGRELSTGRERSADWGLGAGRDRGAGREWPDQRRPGHLRAVPGERYGR